ncbi:MAG: arylsulfatase [Deltaproteobacteria bacterium]|nr:arylsulfatase [Deltaproteobacteria bacterium]
MRSRFQKVKRFFPLLILLCALFTGAAGASKPNIVIIVADDMGWNDVGYHGSEIKTPTIDTLANEGVELDRFYAHPTCSPTRSALMTGQSPIRLGIMGPLSKNNPTGLPLSLTTMPQYFKNAGYQTALVGKWHLGRYKKDYWPQNRGFDHFYGYLTGGIGHYNHVHGGSLDWQRNGEPLREKGYSTHLLTDESVRLIKNRDKNNPLFMVISYAAPHMPNEAPEETVAQYQNLKNEFRRLHAAMVTELDLGIKKIISVLENEAMMDNTIVWFMSDNGGMNFNASTKTLQNLATYLPKILGTPLPIKFLEFGRTNIMESAADNYPLKRGKKSVMEGGIRVPSFIYAPKLLKQHKVDYRITAEDVLPTLITAAGLAPVKNQVVDGVEVWNLLTKKSTPKAKAFITHCPEAGAYLKGNWKLVISFSGELQLYDIIKDPIENNNVAVSNQGVVNALKAEYDAFPRGEIVNIPVWKVFLDPDFFGGEEDRAPMAGFEGHNAAPTSPAGYIALLVFFVVCLLIWYRKRTRIK